MIPGITSQVVEVVVQRGLLEPLFHDDSDIIPSSFIDFDSSATQMLSAVLVLDIDLLYAGTIPIVLHTGFVDVDDLVFAPAFKVDQILAPIIYFDGDVMTLPFILPVVAQGTVLPNLFSGDDAVFAPFVAMPGTLQPSLFGDLEMLFAPSLAQPLTLNPGRHVDADSLTAPLVRQNVITAPFVRDDDAVYAAAVTGLFIDVPLMVGDDVVYSPQLDASITLVPTGLMLDIDIVFLPSEFGGNQILDVGDGLFDFVQEAFFIPVISGRPASFDGTAAGVSLSPNKLSATRTSIASNSGATSTAFKTTGKYYFEITMTVTHGASDCPGLLSSSGSINNMIGGIQCTTLYRSTGNIYSNSANSGKTLGACTNGDVISFAIDLDARKAWLRKNGGNWNGLVLGSENPNGGVGGVVIQPSSSMTPAACFGGTSGAVNDQMVANFGGTASGTPFVYPAPVGFGIWTA